MKAKEVETMRIKVDVPEGETAKWTECTLTSAEEETKDTRPVTERVKTFEDACRELGENHPFIRSFNGYVRNIHEENKNDADILAYLKLRIICAALNEGWEPKFIKYEYRYYPWFYLYTKEEIEDMDEEDRKQLVLWGGVAAYGANCGLAFADSNHAWSNSDTSVGSRLAVKTRELAIYFGKQFTDIWADFVLIHK